MNKLPTVVCLLLAFVLTFSLAPIRAATECGGLGFGGGGLYGSNCYGCLGGAGTNYGLAGGCYNSYGRNTHCYSNQVGAVNYHPYAAYSSCCRGPYSYGNCYNSAYSYPSMMRNVL